MAQGQTIQRPAIALASVAIHAVVLVALALHQAQIPHREAHEDVFAVTVLPRYLTVK